MPTRLLRDMRDSERLQELSAEAERLFWRLFMSVDDHGRFDARPKYLASACFPLAEDVDVDDIRRWRQEIEDAGLINCYVVGPRQYLIIPPDIFRQRQRSQKSKFPDPPDCPDEEIRTCDNSARTLRADDGNMRAYADKCPPKTKTETETNTEDEDADGGAVEAEDGAGVEGGRHAPPGGADAVSGSVSVRSAPENGVSVSGFGGHERRLALDTRATTIAARLWHNLGLQFDAHWSRMVYEHPDRREEYEARSQQAKRDHTDVKENLAPFLALQSDDVVKQVLEMAAAECHATKCEAPVGLLRKKLADLGMPVPSRKTKSLRIAKASA